MIQKGVEGRSGGGLQAMKGKRRSRNNNWPASIAAGRPAASDSATAERFFAERMFWFVLHMRSDLNIFNVHG